MTLLFKTAKTFLSSSLTEISVVPGFIYLKQSASLLNIHNGYGIVFKVKYIVTV